MLVLLKTDGGQGAMVVKKVAAGFYKSVLTDDLYFQELMKREWISFPFSYPNGKMYILQISKALYRSSWCFMLKSQYFYRIEGNDFDDLSLWEF